MSDKIVFRSLLQNNCPTSVRRTPTRRSRRKQGIIVIITLVCLSASYLWFSAPRRGRSLCLHMCDTACHDRKQRKIPNSVSTWHQPTTNRQHKRSYLYSELYLGVAKTLPCHLGSTYRRRPTTEKEFDDIGSCTVFEYKDLFR